MKLAWATDVHFDHLDEADVEDFHRRIADSSAEALLLGGDIANAKELDQRLAGLAAYVPVPTYFVLGNHDYYGGSVVAIRELVGGMDAPPVCWLPAAGIVRLADGLALVGHGGWGDAQHGDFDEAPVLTDYIAIEELVKTAGRRNVLTGMAEREALRRRLNLYGADAAATLRPALQAAAAGGGHVIVLTHVPPFPEAAWHEGELSTIPWQPGFTCKAMGDLLRGTASDHPDCQFNVLCGHTHGSGRATIRPNLRVFTARADYGTAMVNELAWDGTELTVTLV